MGKQVKVGVRLGGGPPPGYLWNVLILDIGFDEVMAFLTAEQYCHLALQFKEIASEKDPTHSVVASIDEIEDFYELRDKGGILGKLSVRIFFVLDRQNTSIVVLGGIKKGNEGQTPTGDRIRIKRRARKYFNGDYGLPDL